MTGEFFTPNQVDTSFFLAKDLSAQRNIEINGPDKGLEDLIRRRFTQTLENLDRVTEPYITSIARLDAAPEGALIGAAAKREAVASAMTGLSMPPVKTAHHEVEMVDPEKPVGKAIVNLILDATPIIEANAAQVERYLHLIAACEKTSSVAILNMLNPHLRFDDTELNIYVMKATSRGQTLYKLRKESGRVLIEPLHPVTEAWKEPTNSEELLERRKLSGPLSGGELIYLKTRGLLSSDELTPEEKSRIEIWEGQRRGDKLPPRSGSESFGEEYLRILENPQLQDFPTNYLPVGAELILGGVLREIRERQDAKFNVTVTSIPWEDLNDAHIRSEDRKDLTVINMKNLKLDTEETPQGYYRYYDE